MLAIRSISGTVYSTILRDWLGLEQSASIDVLGGDFGTVPFLEYSAKSSFGASAATSFKLHPQLPQSVCLGNDDPF